MAKRMGQKHRLWERCGLVPQEVGVWCQRMSFRSDCGLLAFSVMQPTKHSKQCWRLWKAFQSFAYHMKKWAQMKLCMFCRPCITMQKISMKVMPIAMWAVSSDLGLWDVCQQQSLPLSIPTSDSPSWDASHVHPILGSVWVSGFTSVFDVLWASSKLMLWEGKLHSSQLVSELWLGAKWPQFLKLWVGPHQHSWFGTNNH